MVSYWILRAQILWNIFSPVELNTRKQNASMRGRPARQAINYDVDSSDPRRDDYDFLLALSSYPAKNPQLDDLDSTLITMSAARGLTLWGSGSTVDSGAGSATPEEKRNRDAVVISAAEEAQMEESDRSAREDSRPEERRPGQSVAMGEGGGCCGKDADPVIGRSIHGQTRDGETIGAARIDMFQV
ncbi:hypothetical protein JVT61DRAFT_12841 [Boletus reticuloceps]|uniref:Uncharacterized protein n=1 Tax=Boletus reticuloceps TaxID=495285 RepID=A0A8I3ADM2_9AGAM|nr:hypothetical protein JVT61DRAFT_12841 [Boletus reticuloceps]